MTQILSVILADGDASRRQKAAERLLQRADVRECEDTTDLLQTVIDIRPDVVVIGSLGSKPAEAAEAAHLVRDINPATRVIVIADISSEALAVLALRAGVSEYLKAPVDTLAIEEAVYRVSQPRIEQPGQEFENMVGSTDGMQEVKSLVRRIASYSGTVLITGESGTGKEIVARLIHDNSPRAGGPFVCVNCAAIPDTLVESELFGHERGAFTGAVARQTGQMKLADRGTLFLDEIGDLSPTAQAKILRALEQREIQPLGGKPASIDIRLITATHRDLDRLVADEKFRSDLYYRLDVSRIHLPPLRERVADVPVLAVHFLREMNRVYGRQIQGLTPAALQTLARHDWPGNVRQLRNVIEAAVMVCASKEITERDLRALHSFSVSSPAAVKRAAPVIPTKLYRQPEKDCVIEALESTRWNMTKTAELLHWSRSTLYRHIARHKIERSSDPMLLRQPAAG